MRVTHAVELLPRADLLVTLLLQRRLRHHAAVVRRPALLKHRGWVSVTVCGLTLQQATRHAKSPLQSLYHQLPFRGEGNNAHAVSCCSRH